MPVKRKSVVGDEVPPLQNIVNTDDESDDESSLTSDDAREPVALDPDDSMFRPAPLNRVQAAVPPLATRRASTETGSSAADAQNSGARRSSRRTSARAPASQPKKSAGEVPASDKPMCEKNHEGPAPSWDITQIPETETPAPLTDGHVAKENGKRAREPDSQPPNDTNGSERNASIVKNDESPTKRRRETDGPSDVSTSMEDEANSDKKGKKKREQSPDVGSQDGHNGDGPSDPENGEVGQEGAETQEAEGLRKAVQQSRDEARASARSQLGESSASATSHAQTATPPATPSPTSSTYTPPRSAPASSSPGTGSPSPASRRTFAAARLQISGVQSRPVTSAPGAQDPNEFRVRELPARCQVTNPHLQDELLREYYRDLPNLTLGAFMSWSQLRGSGQFPFSHWGDVAPSMDFENALAFINFQMDGRYVNPSRASPLSTRAVRTTPNGFRMNLFVGNEPAILISTIYVRQSHLLSPPARGLRQHLIAGVGHTQEWERQVSFICMVFGQPELRAQLSADVLTYSTRSDTSQNYTSPLGRFSSTQSPSIRVSARSFASSTADPMALGFNEIVPVYDARSSPVDMSNVASLFNLPRFEGEVPPNSFAAVGYTTNAYLSTRDAAWHVSCNIRFVVVVGTPSAEADEDAGAPVEYDA